MFTGIIEDIGQVMAVAQIESNIHLTIKSTFTNALKIDESVAHNGICLTVVAINGDQFTVTAIEETIKKTNIATYKPGDYINLERAMILGSRLDGHIVQGHVDTTGVCTAIEQKEGSVEYTFSYPITYKNLVIEKGSICMNGTSLTAFNCVEDTFTVAIIPYTLAHTTIQYLQVGAVVNLEFDIIGKYILRAQS